LFAAAFALALDFKTPSVAWKNSTVGVGNCVGSPVGNAIVGDAVGACVIGVHESASVTQFPPTQHRPPRTHFFNSAFGHRLHCSSSIIRDGHRLLILDVASNSLLLLRSLNAVVEKYRLLCFVLMSLNLPPLTDRSSDSTLASMLKSNTTPDVLVFTRRIRGIVLESADASIV
jgi:hypothetical protein